jgi:hypothetical protein
VAAEGLTHLAPVRVCDSMSAGVEWCVAANGFLMGGRDVGYFDALTSSYFKTAPDGRKLFFPWGVLGRGYTIASEEHYRRLQQQIKIYVVVSLVLVMGSASLRGYVVAYVIVALLIGFYLVWMGYLLRRLQSSNERLSLRESTASRARALNLPVLWLLEIVALAFVGFGILIFILDPGSRLIALASILFFGLCAVKFTYMLVLRRQHARSSPGPTSS